MYFRNEWKVFDVLFADLFHLRDRHHNVSRCAFCDGGRRRGPGGLFRIGRHEWFRRRRHLVSYRQPVPTERVREPRGAPASAAALLVVRANAPADGAHVRHECGRGAGRQAGERHIARVARLRSSRAARVARARALLLLLH